MSEAFWEKFDEKVRMQSGLKTPRLPKKLYHYTSSVAFLNIVRTGELWFSDYRYANDTSELQYGIELFKSSLRKKESKTTSTFERGLIREAIIELDRVFEYIDIYTFSLCQKNNLLNQWRVYGRGNAPLSIEFDTKSIGPNDWENYSFDIVPIIYDREIQEKIVIAAIDGLGAAFSGEEFATACADWCSQMKHPQFHVEEEWRLSIRWGLEHRTYAGLKHRGNADGIVPYLVMKPSVGMLPITEITVGPCSNPLLQAKAIQDFLHVQSDGWEFVKVSGTTLPIRP